MTQPITPSTSSAPAPSASAYTAYSVSWNLTQRCNLECAHCYMSAFAGADTRGELTTAECRRVMDEIAEVDRKSTRLNSSHLGISYAVFCLKKKKKEIKKRQT